MTCPPVAFLERWWVLSLLFAKKIRDLLFLLHETIKFLVTCLLFFFQIKEHFWISGISPHGFFLPAVLRKWKSHSGSPTFAGSTENLKKRIQDAFVTLQTIGCGKNEKAFKAVWTYFYFTLFQGFLKSAVCLIKS